MMTLGFKGLTRSFGIRYTTDVQREEGPDATAVLSADNVNATVTQHCRHFVWPKTKAFFKQSRRRVWVVIRRAPLIGVVSFLSGVRSRRRATDAGSESRLNGFKNRWRTTIHRQTGTDLRLRRCSATRDQKSSNRGPTRFVRTSAAVDCSAGRDTFDLWKPCIVAINDGPLTVSLLQCREFRQITQNANHLAFWRYRIWT